MGVTLDLREWDPGKDATLIRRATACTQTIKEISYH